MVSERDPLTEVSVYEIGGPRPEIKELRREGTVAFYGLVLQARPSRDLAEYLAGCAVDSLWEYQRGFGVTPEDSCLVIDGLLAAGVNPADLEASAQRLADWFYCPESRAFASITPRQRLPAAAARGRAGYWRGPSLDATAHVAYVMSQIAPDRFSSEIDASTRAVAGWQQRDGSWRSRWYPSPLVATYYAVRLLSTRKAACAAEVDRGADWIAGGQRGDGSWQGSVISTAAAIRALALAGRSPEARERGRTWLRQQRTATGWKGEPVLYYWFDFADGRRLFHHCQDLGPVTTAWALLALRREA